MALASRPGSRRDDLDAAAGEGASLDAAGRAAGRGDVTAFELLYRGTCARIHALARALLGSAHADEATQEVYLRAWRGLAGWRGEASVTTWLHRLARNTLVNLAVRRSLLAREGEAFTEPAAPGSGTGLRLELEEAIERLPDGARTVFVLHDVEGCSHEEIAAHLGRSVGTSKSQLHRARMLLRAALGEGRTS